jgi:hypothetical protein
MLAAPQPGDGDVMNITRTNAPLVLLLLVLALTSAGCELIEGVFKAGLWVGVILVLIVVGLVVWILGKMRR